MEFEETLGRAQALIGRRVTATLTAPDGRRLARWDGELAREELDTDALADRIEPRVAGHDDAERRVRALRAGHVALFTVGGDPLVIDAIDTARAEPIEPEGLRIRDSEGMTVELVPTQPA